MQMPNSHLQDSAMQAALRIATRTPRATRWRGCEPDDDGDKLTSFASLSGSSSAVERQLPKLDVAGSIPVSRSINPTTYGSPVWQWFVLPIEGCSASLQITHVFRGLREFVRNFLT